MMVYNELIKKFDRIRDYVREFYLYGFKSREEFTKKSTPSYGDGLLRVGAGGLIPPPRLELEPSPPHGEQKKHRLSVGAFCFTRPASCRPRRKGHPC